MNDTLVPLGPREMRLPLFVPLHTEPALSQCWSVNISSSGMGMVAARRSGQNLPNEGDILAVHFHLPDTDLPLSAEMMVMWRHDAPERAAWLAAPAAAEESIAFGLSFRQLLEPLRYELQRYLAAYRFQVAVLGLAQRQWPKLAATLANHCRLLFAESSDEAMELSQRGDLAAIVVFAEHDIDSVRQIARARTWDADALPLENLASDRAPRLIVCGASHYAADLIPFFNDGVLYRALTLPVSDSDLEQAVAGACRDYAVRAEQKRVALSLERSLSRLRARYEPALSPRDVQPKGLIYCGEPMATVLGELYAVAPHKVPVLLQGETGTGKEVLARLLHERSVRQEAPFVIQDCGTLVESLLDSELFGHVKGAFTGAVSNYSGVFAQADGGTVFLDEIQDMTPRLQAKLLRVIETGDVRPVGAAKQHRIDVRIVAATNCDLSSMVAQGKFRADLYYRLSTFPLEIPPLRQRPGDIEILAQHFLQEANRLFSKTLSGFADESMKWLKAHDWPGNVRELRHVIERAALLSMGLQIELSSIVRQTTRRTTSTRHAEVAHNVTLRELLAQTEAAHIAKALAKSNGVLHHAATILGMNPVTLGRRVRLYGLQ